MKLSWKKVTYVSFPGLGSRKNWRVQVKWDVDTQTPDEINVTGYADTDRKTIIREISKMLYGDGKPDFDDLKDCDEDSIEIENTVVFSDYDCKCPRCGESTVAADMIFKTADFMVEKNPDFELPKDSVGIFTWTIMCPECHLQLGAGFHVNKNFNFIGKTAHGLGYNINTR